MAKLDRLTDAFTGGSINTAIWNSITAASSLDTLNDQIVVQVPVTASTTTFGSTIFWDATGSSICAQVGIAAFGNGLSRTLFMLRVDGSNNITMRIESGVFRLTVLTAGATVVTPLPAYDPHAHRWWRLREAGGTFFADASPDGLNWTTLASTAYAWAATNMQFLFQTAATGTEAAGNVATLAHVNTRNGGQANPNWPLVEHGAGLAWDANDAVSPLDLYVDVTSRAGPTSIDGGRQYEWDQTRAAEESTTLANTDGALDPASSTSPLAGQVQPFGPYRIRAMWPPTPNLLSQGIASGGSYGGVPTGTITPSAALDLLTDTDTTGGSVVASATAWLGPNVTAVAVPSGTATGQRIVHSAQTAVAPGRPYTLSIRVRDVTASTALQVKPHIGWVTAGSHSPSTYVYGTTATLTGATAAGWTVLTVGGTAPAGALGIDVGVTVAATAAADCTVQTSGWQLQHGLTVSPWACPGVWSPMASVFTEDWTSRWDMGGTYGTVTPPASDAFSLLSQLTLSGPLAMETGSHAPRFLYKLDDTEASTTAADSTGTCPAATVKAGKYGAGTATFGTEIAASTAAGVYTGSDGTVLGLTNSNPGSPSNSAASYLSLDSAGIVGPATHTYTRIIAFRYTGPTPASAVDIWTALDGNHGLNPSSLLRLFIDPTGHLNATTQSVFIGGISLASTATVTDGNWHLAVFGFQEDSSGTFFLSLDGAYTSTGGDTRGYSPFGLVSDSVGAFVDGSLGGATHFNFTGAVSFVGEFPALLTSTDCADLYTAWRPACAGESTGARYARILRYAGYTGPTSIQAGLTASMGPAATDGQDVVSALQDVVTTEGGSHYIAPDGTPTFRSRGSRYNAITPAVTFGENAGEIPYEDAEVVYDSAHLANRSEVTQASTGQVFYAKDDASGAAFFPRTMDRTVNVSSGLEAQDAANYLVNRYKRPLSRVSTLVLHPSANPAIWPVCLGLTLGTRARVMRRPPGVAASQFEVFVENLEWALDDTGEAFLTLQCSPADLTQYLVMASWHTTLASGISSGVTSITVNASQDTVNPLVAQLAAGQQLVLGQGTANQETVTVLAVGATSPGWATAAVTLTAATTKSHAAGDIVCDLLPAGVTDPAAYDPFSAFDASVFAY